MTMHIPTAVVVGGEPDVATDTETTSKLEWVEPAMTVVVTVIAVVLVSLYSVVSTLL